MHPDLIVTRKGIQEVKQSATRRIIHQGINARKWVGVLQAGLVEVCEVDAHPPLPTSLLHQHHVRQPLWVLNLPNVASAQQLLCLFSDDLTPFIIELSSSLADRSDLGVHGETMTQEIGINARHV